jgi:hypothetical protein
MADAEVWKAIAELERRVARLELRQSIGADAEPETLPGVTSTPGSSGGESPVFDAVADALEALGFVG